MEFPSLRNHSEEHNPLDYELDDRWYNVVREIETSNFIRHPVRREHDREPPNKDDAVDNDEGKETKAFEEVIFELCKITPKPGLIILRLGRR